METDILVLLVLDCWLCRSREKVDPLEYLTSLVVPKLRLRVDLHPSLALSHVWSNQCDGAINPPQDLLVAPEVLAHVRLVCRYWLLNSLLLVHHLTSLNILKVDLIAIRRLFHSKPLLQPLI